MSTTEQQAPGPNSALSEVDADRIETLYWIKQIANGDFYAEQVMCAFWDFNHMLDDLVDQDKPCGIERVGAALATFTAELTMNPFWHKWGAHLLPLYLSCVNRWIDGEDWPDKKEAAIIRCGDVDFMLQFAYCTGGWQHLRAMRGARTYDKED